jgi:4-hydroxybenzoate polyprenyltransferase
MVGRSIRAFCAIVPTNGGAELQFEHFTFAVGILIGLIIGSAIAPWWFKALLVVGVIVFAYLYAKHNPPKQN